MAHAAIQKSILLLFSYMSHLIREEKQATGAGKQPTRAGKQCCVTGATKQHACEALAMNCQEQSAAKVYLSQIHISTAKQQPNVLTVERPFIN